MSADPIDSAAELRIDAILVEGRHRKDLGDIKALADSIDDLGLIHPPVVTPGNRLVAGERRLAAVRSLGWDTVPVTVIHTLNGAGDLLQAECDENTCRKDFTPTEAAAIRKAVEGALAPVVEQERREAVSRSQAENNSRSKGRTTDGRNLRPSVRNKTSEVAAKGTGYSGRTLDKVDEVVEAVESPETPEPVKDIAREAIAEMDATGNVSKAHQKVTEAQQVHDAAAEFPDLAYYAETGRGRDAIRLANALRGYAEPELSVRIDALRKSIAAEKEGRWPPKRDTGPDFRALADKMFFAANNASSIITRSGGTDTIAAALHEADQLTIANWRSQFQSLAEICRELSQACTPKLKVMK